MVPRYLAHMYYDDSLGLRAREALTNAIANMMIEEFELDATYYSVLGSDYIDDVPSYTDISKLGDRYLNYAHDKRDF